MKRHSKFYVMLLVLFMSFMSGTVSFAQEVEKPTCDASLTFYSQYIWRAQELSKNSLVIFPEVTVSYKGFGFTLWGDFDTDYEGAGTDIVSGGENNDTRWWETDMVLTYSNSFEKLNYTLGWIYYDVDTGDDEEVFVVLGYDCLLSPEVSVWRGIEYGESWYTNFALSHSFEFENGHSFDLGANAGWWYHPYGDKDYDAWHDLNFSAGYNIPLNEFWTVSASINYTTTLSSEAEALADEISFDGDDHDFIYGGIAIAASF